MDILMTIDGMRCGGCVASVHRALSSVPSVAAVKVDLGSRSALISGDATLDPAKLVAAVEAAGYDARPEV